MRTQTTTLYSRVHIRLKLSTPFKKHKQSPKLFQQKNCPPKPKIGHWHIPHSCRHRSDHNTCTMALLYCVSPCPVSIRLFQPLSWRRGRFCSAVWLCSGEGQRISTSTMYTPLVNMKCLASNVKLIQKSSPRLES